MLSMPHTMPPVSSASQSSNCGTMQASNATWALIRFTNGSSLSKDTRGQSAGACTQHGVGVCGFSHMRLWGGA